MIFSTLRAIRGVYAFFASFLLAVCAGVGIWLGSPRGLWPCVLLGIAALWSLVHRTTWIRAFFWGFITGVVFFYLAFDWAYVASGTLAARIALSTIEASFWGILAVLWAGIWRCVDAYRHWWSVLIALLASGAAWAGIEMVRSSVPFGGLPWSLLGYQLVDSPLVRLAPYGSTELVGAAGVIVGILIALTVKNALTIHVIRATLAGCTALVLCFLPLALPIGAGDSSRSVRAAIVQGNAPEIGSKEAARWSEVTTQNHIDAAYGILNQDPELIIFPESTSERDYRADSSLTSSIFALAEHAHVPLLVGTQKFFTRGEGDDQRYVRTNDYVVQYPGGILPKSTDTYSKQHPVPFGEYIPMRSMFADLSPRLNEIATDMVAGEKPARLGVSLSDGYQFTAATPICFEVAYSHIVSEGVRGSQLLIVPTSNVTFGRSDEALQQFDITRFRAIENARTAVHVSTMGISGVVTAQGEIVYRTDLFEQDARVVDLPLYSSYTLATRTYEMRSWITAICALGAVALSAMGLLFTPRIRPRVKVPRVKI